MKDWEKEFELIEYTVCNYFDVTPRDLRKKKRDWETSLYPRFIIWNISRDYFGIKVSFAKLGSKYGFPHCTVIHSAKRVNELIDTDIDFARTFNNLTEECLESLEKLDNFINASDRVVICKSLSTIIESDDIQEIKTKINQIVESLKD